MKGLLKLTMIGFVLYSARLMAQEGTPADSHIDLDDDDDFGEQVQPGITITVTNFMF